MLNRCTAGLLALLGVLFSLGCGGGGIANKVHFRAMNAVPDQPNITVMLDGTSLTSSVAYGTAGDYTETKSGSRHLQVEPSSATNVFLDQTFNLNGATNNTAIIANFSTASGVILLTDDNTAPATGKIKLRIVNAAPNLGTVDVYVVPPGTDINNATPAVVSLGFESSSAYLSLSAGSYDFVFTPHGSTFAFLDTGAVAFNAGQNRTIVALNSLSGGFSVGQLNDLN
jgi:Domain of unknown function (DUF4397)